MANLNLNISSFNDGSLMADIYILTAVNPDSNDRETIGIFANKKAAVDKGEFWMNVMHYTDVRIEYNILNL